jgi:hypothetical protein
MLVSSIAEPRKKQMAESDEEWRRRHDVPLVLLNERMSAAKPLPITALEEVLSWRSGYSSFANRYVLLTQRPKDGRFGRSIWPLGRSQPVYLMTSEGDVSVIEVPSKPAWNTVLLALPSKVGLVFKGGGGPANRYGGLFLYDSREVRSLDLGKTATLAVSPNGCGAAYAIVDDFGKASKITARVKSIDFCKGET